MRKTVFLVCTMFLYSVLSWGQTWKLSETMTAFLDSRGVLTISTTANAEAMPDYGDPNDGAMLTPWLPFGNGEKITTVVIENNVTSVGKWVFYGLNNLISITFGKSVKTIGENAFRSCYSLINITIPNSVTEIGVNAFNNCHGLISITIPNSVTKIEEYAFDVSGDLEEVTVSWSTPLTVPENTFGSLNTSVVTLHVPAGTQELYQASSVWKDFKYDLTDNEQINLQILKVYASNGLLTISGLQAGKPISIHSISGQIVYKGVAKAETEQIPMNVTGIYIVTSENQTIKAIIE